MRKRKIYNVVLLPSLVAAHAWQAFHGGWLSLLAAGGGFLLGGALLVLFFAVGGMGAGDVKMMAVVGAWKGALFVGEAVLLGALAGGVLTIATAAWHRRLRQLFFSVATGILTLVYHRGKVNPFPRISESQGNVITVPYGVALTAGTVLAWLWRW